MQTKKPTMIAVLLVCTLVSACGTLCTAAADHCGKFGPYSGTRASAGGHGTQIDLPLSLIADTLLLPISIPKAIIDSLSSEDNSQDVTSSRPAFEYTSVADAWGKVSKMPGFSFKTYGTNGWRLGSTEDGPEWAFTTQEHYAHPSVIAYRFIFEKGMRHPFWSSVILCEAGKDACDRLIAESRKKVFPDDKVYVISPATAPK